MCQTEYTKDDWAEDGGAHDFRINGDSLYYYDDTFGREGIKVHFCPMCGRPLSEAAKTAALEGVILSPEDAE